MTLDEILLQLQCLLHSPVSSHHCRVSHQHGFRVCRLISAWCYVFVYCKCHWANVCRLSYTCERFHTHWVLRCSLPLPLKMMFLRFSHVDTKRFISFSYYRYPVHNNFINYFSILLLINFEFVSFFLYWKMMLRIFFHICFPFCFNFLYSWGIWWNIIIFARISRL